MHPNHDSLPDMKAQEVEERNLVGMITQTLYTCFTIEEFTT